MLRTTNSELVQNFSQKAQIVFLVHSEIVGVPPQVKNFTALRSSPDALADAAET
jgi:hypothetical protein